jgi:broad specificity phosphatase PhoE
MGERGRLYLVRHGQSDLNLEGRFRGLTDAPLNEVGRKEAAGAAAILDGSGVSVIYTSPVPRALQTAEILAGSIDAAVEREEGFTDVDYGEWQGMTVGEVEQRFGSSMLNSWKRDPEGFTFPGGDSMRSVQSRLGPALTRVVANRGGDVAVVSHLAVLKLCFLIIMELPTDYFWKIDVYNGSVSMFSYGPDNDLRLEWWNRAPEIAHG